MEKEDKYWVIESSYSFRYFKNGKFHREAGPALIFKNDTNFNSYLNLGDEYLYQDKRKQIQILQNMERQQIGGTHQSSKFYLDGTEYSKQEFYSLKIKKELEQELPIHKSSTKKIKI